MASRPHRVMRWKRETWARFESPSQKGAVRALTIETIALKKTVTALTMALKNPSPHKELSKSMWELRLTAQKISLFPTTLPRP
jgi:hypothetical protein